jgi:subtilisin family serine protease
LWLERRPDVDRVIDNPILRPLPSPEETKYGNDDGPKEPTWNLTRIGADRVWRDFGVDGEGIVIGHADSGVQGTHPELLASYRGYNSGDDYNWYDPWYGSLSPTDPSGHGTHTLGTILGARTGVAPGAQWFGCANLARGLGNPALYLDCLQFLLAPYPAGGDPFTDGDPSRSAHVINNSWLCPEIEGCDDMTLIEAVKALRQAGIFMVVAAGNEGPWCGSIRFPPATFDEVFSVGAINRNGDIASFSSIGPVESDARGRIKPDLVAPGDGILSAFPQDTYEIQAGTSMAAPHVAGVVALMWSANPSLVGDIEQTEKILAETASPYLGRQHACVDGDKVPNNGSGYGVLNAYEAVKTALALQ